MAGLVDIGGIFDGLFGLAGEFIEDKDKRNQINMEIMKIQNDLKLSLLKTKTHPKVDAVVKVMLALNTFWRPMVSGAMTIFGAYCHITEGIDLGSAQYIFDGAFLGWGASRHIEKNKKK